MIQLKKCIYCNSTLELTKDHVPPKSFFPDPKPSNLITVDCFKKCNNSFDKEDEYMLTIISMRHDVAEHKSGQKLQDKLHRRFRKLNKIPFLKSIANKTNLENVITPSGIYLGKAAAYLPEGDRIIRFMKRITAGIYNHETRRKLPLDNKFAIFDESNLLKQPEMVKKILFPIYVELANKAKNVIGENVFSYSYQILEDYEFAILCFISFFDYVQYFCISNPTK